MAEALLASPLVGRKRPQESLRRWVADLVAGRGRAVLVEGEPGIGKSSLVAAAAQDAETAGCQLVWATCDELNQAFPLLPLIQALDARPGVRGREHESISELLRAGAAPGSQVDAVAAAIERVLAVLDDLCAAIPVLLVVDDLQWADAATVQVLGRLARLVQQLPLLVVGTARPVPHRDDLSALRRAIAAGDLIRLHSFTGAEVTEFVERAVGGAPGPRLLRLAEGASGNPLYLTELIDAVARGEYLSVEDGTVEVATSGRTPQSLAAAIADRLDFLSSPARAVLRAAALLGSDFSVAELAAVAGRPVTALVPLLDEALLAGVLRESGTELAFRHPLIRQALYDGMPAALRAAWHRDAGRALADAGAGVERVARQLLPAVEPDAATGAVDDWIVRWLVDAGQRLISQAPDAAAPLLRWAVEGLPAGAPEYELLACRLAGALYKTGDAAEAARVASTALPHVTRSDVLLDLHLTLGQCRAMEGRPEESLTALDHIVDSPQIEPRHRARLLLLSARAHHNLGKVDAAGRFAEAALKEANAAGDRWAAGWALGALALVRTMRGDTSEALPFFERALAVAAGDPSLADLRLLLQVNQASTLGDLDQYDDAITAAQLARRLADSAGNTIRLAQAQCVLGELLFDLGRWDDALVEIDAEPGGLKNPTVECTGHGLAATILFHRGEASAADHLAAAERYADRIGDRVLGPLLLATSVGREVADRPAGALAALMTGLSETAEETEETADLLADAVRLAMTAGDENTAKNVTRRAEALAHESQVPHRLGIAAHCRGLYDNDPELLLQAANLYKTAGRPLPRAQTLEAAGIALADRGDISGARTHFTEAYAVYTDLGAQWDLARTQATFRKYGIRRGPQVRHRRAQHGWDSLTPTEVKVVELVAKGMSNPDIAAQLFLSRRTVQTHVSHILTKLNLHSRIDIAREASRRSES